MVSLPRLLVFCDYLENRLHTSSLSLLRRMVTDFYAGNEHTLVDFMRLGASVVSVMPIERSNPRHRKEAARLLSEQEEDDAHDDQTQLNATGSQQLATCVFRFLTARVATKNILWLRDMFQEFTKSEDAILREFVSRGDEPICVIPVDIQALRMTPLPPPPLIPGTVSRRNEHIATLSQATPSPTSSLRRKRKRDKDRRQQGASEENDMTGDTVDSHKKKQRHCAVMAKQEESKVAATLEPKPLASPTIDEIRQSIMTTMKRIEKTEPWKSVFKPETLVMPFSRVRHPKLAEALQEFWHSHARAVWERKFWTPLSRTRTPKLHNQRRCRQSKAQSFFEKRVLIPAHKELGASFFVDMDRRATPYSGWDYRDQAVDLLSLAQRYSLSTCLEYIESEACKRFPVVPGKSRRFFTQKNGKSQSMWSSSTRLRPALNEIVATESKADSNNPSAHA